VHPTKAKFLRFSPIVFKQEKFYKGELIMKESIFKNRTSIKKIDLNEVQFCVITKEALNNKKLSDPAFRLLVRLYNNDDNYIINTTQIAKEFKWSNDKMAKAIKCLEQNNYFFKKRIMNEKNQMVGWENFISLDNSPTSDFPKVGNPESRETRSK